MITSHAALYHSDPHDRTRITHHADPRNGMVHNGHPKECPVPSCRAWGSLMCFEADAEQSRIDAMNDLLQEGQGAIVWTVVLGTLAVCGGAAWLVWRNF